MTQLPEGTFARPGAGPVERAGLEFRRALANGDSALTPGRAIWTLAHAQELLDRFNGQPDVPGASFDEKLAHQLAGSSADAVQLFAELYLIDLLPLSDYNGTTKHALVMSTLALAGLTFPLTGIIEEAFSGGVLNGGVAFKIRRYWQMCLLIEFAVGFTAMDDAERARLLDDPKAFRDALDGVTSTNAPSQKATLLYLFFPKFFLPIAKAEHRSQIKAAFADKLDRSSGDQDEDLRDIYAALVGEAGHHIDLYQAPYREKWDPIALTSLTYQQPPWDRFMAWAAQIADSVNLADQERTYKIEMARRLDVARSAIVSGDADWAVALKRALSYGNLLDRFFKTSFLNALTDQPDRVRSVIAEFWSGEPSSARLATFSAGLQSLGKITPGNAVALGSVLLMARDSALFPPYRPTPMQTALRLTGTVASGTGPVERYDDLLTLCDQVLERAGDGGIELQDRLDAQGLIWAVSTYAPPADWPEPDKKAFVAWRGDTAASGESSGPRAWMVRGGSGAGVVQGWLQRGRVSLAATRLREVSPGITRDELKPIVDEDFSHTSYAAREDKLDEFYSFLTRMEEGHLVATIDHDHLYLGEIAGDAVYELVSAGQSNLTRSVRWARTSGGLQIGDLPGELQARLAVQRDVVDLTLQLSVLEQLFAAETAQAAPPAVAEVVLPSATDELATELHVDQAWLQKCIDLLNDRPQLIFYGPPGTGKTYIAQRLAKHVAGTNVRLVQFHPAYAYEDFFEGFRPVETGGFKLKAGPMRRIVDQAVENPAVPHVLIIDEINRGNLAKVFGELYFLLEYRDRNVELLYADAESAPDFSLPKNVYIIGTMNTADRSIALVDAAMRRRFAFLPLHPSELPTSGVLRSWLRGSPERLRVADLLDELNRQIEDEDFKIGPSYFMRPAVYSDGGLERTWETSILPLLEEHHYGDLTRTQVAARYGLAAIARRIAKAPDLAEQEPVADDLGDAGDGSIS